MDASETRPGYRLFVGVDIAAATATVAWRSVGGPVGRPIRIEQTSRGFAVLQERLRTAGHAPREVLVYARERLGSLRRENADRGTVAVDRLVADAAELRADRDRLRVARAVLGSADQRRLPARRGGVVVDAISPAVH